MHRSRFLVGNLYKGLIFAFGSLSLDFHFNYSIVQGLNKKKGCVSYINERDKG